MKIKSNKKIILIVLGGIVVIMGALCLGGLNMMKEINEEKSVAMDEVNSIQVDMTSIGVHFIRTETINEIKANFHGKAMQEIKLISKTDNKTLFLTVQRKHENAPLYEDVVLDVYIPKTYTKNLSIKMLSGAVKMDSFNLANFSLDTLSGKLEAEKINAEEITITSSSGGINIKSLETKDFKMVGKSSAINIDECTAKKAEMETSSGKLKAEKINAEEITITSSSGDINIKSIDTKDFKMVGKSSAININKCTAKKAEMETSSGSITLKNSIGDFNLKSLSGKVLVDYKNFEDQNVNIETSSGSVTLELPDTAEFMIEAKTSSGNFKSDFAIKITDKKDINGRIGTKKNEIILQTSSGSIKILKKTNGQYAE